jgi:hypothetical protein
MVQRAHSRFFGHTNFAANIDLAGGIFTHQHNRKRWLSRQRIDGRFNLRAHISGDLFAGYD